MDCPICCQPFQKRLVKIDYVPPGAPDDAQPRHYCFQSDGVPIVCPKCAVGICFGCVAQVLVGTIHDARCMMPTCRQPWDRVFCDRVLSKSFRDGLLKLHRQNVLLDRERAMLPSLVNEASRYRKIYDQKAAIHSVRKELAGLQRLTRDKRWELNEMDAALFLLEAQQQPQQTQTKMVRRCQYGGCNGLLNDEWLCTMCQRVTCAKCRVVLQGGDSHACDPDTVSSIKEVERHSRPCPGCSLGIDRTDGCDHMFCPMCKTGFSWRTGERIADAQNTNPLFYEWRESLHQQPAVNGDVSVGFEAPVDSCRQLSIDDVLRWSKIVRPTWNEAVCGVFKVMKEVRDVHLVHLNGRLSAALQRTSSDRIDYLIGVFSEESWKARLQANEKARLKYAEIVALLTTFVDSISDYIRDLIRNGGTTGSGNGKSGLIAWLDAPERLRSMVNEELDTMEARFNATMKRYRVPPFTEYYLSAELLIEKVAPPVDHIIIL